MCNSLQTPGQQLPAINAAEDVCSNKSVLPPQYSIGKIFPTSVAAKETMTTTTSSNNSNSCNSNTPPAKEKQTIEMLRKGQNLPASKMPFLYKLHILLDDVEATGNDHIVSWLEHGKSFKVYRPNSFIKTIAPLYFKQTRYKSFQRQLHLYEFVRTPYGPESGSYAHPLFVRGNPSLCLSLSPVKIKGKAGRQRQVAGKATTTETKQNATARTQTNMLLDSKAVSVDEEPHTSSDTNPALYENTDDSMKSTVVSAVLSKKEQQEWVAKIQRMIVKGSTLAQQLQNSEEKPLYYPEQQHHQQDQQSWMGESAFPHEHRQEEQQKDLLLETKHFTDRPGEACSVLGGCFHYLPLNHDVNQCSCCHSDHEDNYEEDDDDNDNREIPFLETSASFDYIQAICDEL